MIIEGFELRETCMACPEQYDVRDDAGNQVGYLRLRFGRFYAAYPDAGGEIVFEKIWRGDDYKGCFDSDEERGLYLTLAVRSLRRAMLPASVERFLLEAERKTGPTP